MIAKDRSDCKYDKLSAVRISTDNSPMKIMYWEKNELNSVTCWLAVYRIYLPIVCITPTAVPASYFAMEGGPNRLIWLIICRAAKCPQMQNVPKSDILRFGNILRIYNCSGGVFAVLEWHSGECYPSKRTEYDIWHLDKLSLLIFHSNSFLYCTVFRIYWIFIARKSFSMPPRYVFQGALIMLSFCNGIPVSVIFISFVTSCLGPQEEEPQTAHPMSFTWASHIAASMYYGM